MSDKNFENFVEEMNIKKKNEHLKLLWKNSENSGAGGRFSAYEDFLQ